MDAARVGPRTGSLATTVALGVLGLVILAAVVVLTEPGWAVLVVSYAIPALILARRRPRQPIAWLLLLMAIGLALRTTAVTATLEELLSGEADPLGRFTAWANGTGWCVVFAGWLGLTLAFPEGTLPRGRWRALSMALIAASVPLAVLLMFGPTITVTLADEPSRVAVPNPFALPFLAEAAWVPHNAVLWPSLFSIEAIAMISLLDRFRRSSGLERLQYRWLWWAVLFVAFASLVWAVVTTVLVFESAIFGTAIVIIAYPAIPVAVVVAVLRYRLYEIDRLVSRTLGWGLATATVVGLFVVAVLALQALLVGITQGETLAVAASTLIAFAAFQPIRSRVQALVDRRFDRPRLEAERSLAAYGERLQHEVDLEALRRDVESTVEATLRPSSAGLWIRTARGQPP